MRAYLKYHKWENCYIVPNKNTTFQIWNKKKKNIFNFFLRIYHQLYDAKKACLFIVLYEIKFYFCRLKLRPIRNWLHTL